MTPKQYRIIFTLLLLIILVLPVTAQQGCPDLIIRKLTVSPMNPSPRSIVTVRVEVQNIGDTMTPDFTWCKIIYPGGPKQFKILKMSNNRIQIVNHKFRLPNTLPRVQVVAMVNVSNFSMSRHLRFRGF